MAGGTTAALTAALTSAREGTPTCLVEPTPWPGGQMTAGGVPAIDYAWHSIGTFNVGTVAKNPANLPPELVAWMKGIPLANCWVSQHCYQPKALLNTHIFPAIQNARNLKVFYYAVVKRVNMSGGYISSVQIVQRTPRPGIPLGGFDRNLSQDMADWYSSQDSARYTKTLITLKSPDATPPVVIDTTEFGDVLALSQAPWIQGAEVLDGSLVPDNDQCGQAVVFPFTIRYHGRTVVDPAPPPPSPLSSFYSLASFTWERVWSYRRIGGTTTAPTPGDISLQNWNPGNDYPFGYVFKNRAATNQELADWRGGINYDELARAESHAYGWYHWYVARNPFNQRSHFSLDGDTMGTGHGLSMMPYLRDIRRSVGIGNFLLTEDDFSGGPDGRVGRIFADRVAIGAYNVDIHPLKSCTLPSYNYMEKPALPFYIPFRALTNRDVPNLLVAGKTMAQSFKANAAIRLQPIEFSSGIGAGAAASVMRQNGEVNSRWALSNIGVVQSVARNYTPINWTITGLSYPGSPSVGSGGVPGGGPIVVPAIVPNTFCPAGAQADRALGYCVDTVRSQSFGPYPKAMVDACIRWGGGAPCTQFQVFTVGNLQVSAPRWELKFANRIRGTGRCPIGSALDSRYKDYCVEEATQSASKIKEIYGPFPNALVEKCFAARGGGACYSNRWSYAFFQSLIGS